MEGGSTDSKLQLFDKLLKESNTNDQLSYLSSLLSIWNTDNNNNSNENNFIKCYYELLTETLNRNEIQLFTDIRLCYVTVGLSQEVSFVT